MAWIHRSKTRFRILDRLDGRTKVIVKNVGIQKGWANTVLVHLGEAVKHGFTFTPPITVADIEDFNRAIREGSDTKNIGRRITVEEMMDLYLKYHGPSLKGGITTGSRTPYYNLQKRLILFKNFWPGKYVDEFHKFDIRDFLAAPLVQHNYKKGTISKETRYKSVGTQMKYLGQLGHIFRCFYDWNEENVLGFQVKLPKFNPATKWRKEMKSSQKQEHPDTRVLSHEEWLHFRRFLKPQTLAICEAAVFRLQRKADIQHRNPRQVTEGFIQGLQQKTGEPFKIPVLTNHPNQYNFKNFDRDFDTAQKKAGMFWPARDPKHFSFKDLRRTGAMWAYRATLDLAGVSAMLGHKDWKTTKRYLNITGADTQRITDKLDKLAGGPIYGEKKGRNEARK